MKGEMVRGHCTNSSSETYRGDRWVRVEVEVRGAEHITHFAEGRKVLEYDTPQIGGGSVSQLRPGGEDRTASRSARATSRSRGRAIRREFRKIEVLNLSGCMNPKA